MRTKAALPGLGEQEVTLSRSGGPLAGGDHYGNSPLTLQASATRLMAIVYAAVR
jgi:hypothetical protein